MKLSKMERGGGEGQEKEGGRRKKGERESGTGGGEDGRRGVPVERWDGEEREGVEGVEGPVGACKVLNCTPSGD